MNTTNIIRLSDIQKENIKLRKEEGYSHKQISGVLNIPLEL